MPDTRHGFYVHPGRESWKVTTDLLADLADAHPEWRVGVALHVPRQRLAYWQRAVGEWEPLTDFVLADPETTRLDRAFEDRGRGRDDYEYLAESDPVANTKRFARTTLAAQRAIGADVLVSPWLLHGVTQTEHELSATIECAERAREFAEGAPLFMGVEATEGVFGTTEARNAMMNELVEGPELPVYLRTRITAPAGFKQYEKEVALSGLRDVVRALEANDRPVSLPQSGMVGWLMCAFGARSFGAGMAAAMQRNTSPASGGGGFAPLHWYFVPQLLGFVLSEEMPDIADLDGFDACECPYCEGDLPGQGAQFDADQAGKHFLWWCARLAAELDAADPLTSVQSRVAIAAELAGEIDDEGVTLDDRSRPTHLRAWASVLSG
jgi:hypothetical protein